MELQRLTADIPVANFDCGDEDLNGFLRDDAIPSDAKHIANSFVLMDDGNVVAYFCLLTDKITKQEVSKADWRRFKKQFPHGKQFSSYPSIKVGRFAVSKDYCHQGVGANLIGLIKLKLLEDVKLPAFRFLTVDAYIKAIPFYEFCDFKQLQPLDKDKDTRLMYFDMLSLIDK